MNIQRGQRWCENRRSSEGVFETETWGANQKAELQHWEEQVKSTVKRRGVWSCCLRSAPKSVIAAKPDVSSESGAVGNAVPQPTVSVRKFHLSLGASGSLERSEKSASASAALKSGGAAPNPDGEFCCVKLQVGCWVGHHC